MSPRSTGTNRPDRLVLDVVSSREDRGSFRAGSNGNHVRQGQLGLDVKLTACASALHSHIAHVVCVRPEKQVHGIATGWVIAAMQNVKALRDRAKSESPSHPMCAANSARLNESMVDKEKSIPTALTATPRPTFIFVSGINQRPEANVDWSLYWHSESLA